VEKVVDKWGKGGVLLVGGGVWRGSGRVYLVKGKGLEGRNMDFEIEERSDFGI
jgi:hypothetical protein